MKTSLGLTVTTLLLAVANLSAATRYVSLETTNPTPPYATWATAATNIQDAVVAAVAGDEIVVTNGTYAGGSRVEQGVSNRVVVDKPLVLSSVNGPDVTVIDGSGTVRCVYLTNDAEMVGFTLTNGVAQHNNGGGLYCESTSTVVSNCVLTSNSANSGGGAYGGTLKKCVFTGNTVLAYWVPNPWPLPIFRYFPGFGGGAYGSALNDCTLTSNSASDLGGGVYGCTLNNCALTGNAASGSPLAPSGHGGGAYGGTLNNCVLSGNSAINGSGGGTCGDYYRSCTLNNCTLAGNSSDGYGGGASDCTLNNCTVVGNLALDSGGGVASSTLANCIVAYNASWTEPNYAASTLDYCCTSPLPTGGLGNIAVHPMFVDYTGGNLRLQTNSPCINSGNNIYAPGPTDLDSNPRTVGGTVDIGAYEFQSPASCISYAWLQQHGLPTDGSAALDDADADGMNNWQEWRCGTCPTNANSALRLLSSQRTGTNVTVRWQSVAGMNYFLECSTSLPSSALFTPLATGIPGQPSTTSYTDTNAAGISPRFYRVGVGN